MVKSGRGDILVEFSQRFGKNLMVGEGDTAHDT